MEPVRKPNGPPPRKKSTTCYGVTSGTPLTEYDSWEDADAGARHVHETYGGPRMVPYECSVCSRWHLSPADRHTPTLAAKASAGCSCVASDGVTPKESYVTEADACRRADIIAEREGGVRLRVYECPESTGGWHLTHHHTTTTTTSFSATKSTTCRGATTQGGGEHWLTEYETLGDATRAAAYTLERHGHRMHPYECAVCGKWHLSPVVVRTGTLPQKSETCTGSTGQKLTEYATLEDAREGADHALRRYGHRMRPWECPACGKWHLSPWRAEQEDSNRHNTHHHQKPASSSSSSRKSTTCRGAHGQMLTEYDTLEAAQQGADYVLERYGGDPMEPRECSICGKWHLSRPHAPTHPKPVASSSSRKSTTCRGANGQMLTEYDTLEAARQGAEYVLVRYGGDRLEPRECSDCGKWHLSRARIDGTA